ncbi:MAG TPA: hypothetical protein VJ728_04180 [Candidatus Binataceae bacterium]|nr:hypothetical protein [Candidatus Binataceae bacterium]
MRRFNSRPGTGNRGSILEVELPGLHGQNTALTDHLVSPGPEIGNTSTASASFTAAPGTVVSHADYYPDCASSAENETKIKIECLDAELIQDLETVNTVFADILSFGQMLVCHGCDDPAAVVVGFLVQEEDEQAWALCDGCLRELRLKGSIA